MEGRRCREAVGGRQALMEARPSRDKPWTRWRAEQRPRHASRPMRCDAVDGEAGGGSHLPLACRACVGSCSFRDLDHGASVALSLFYRVARRHSRGSCRERAGLSKVKCQWARSLQSFHPHSSARGAPFGRYLSCIAALAGAGAGAGRGVGAIGHNVLGTSRRDRQSEVKLTRNGLTASVNQTLVHSDRAAVQTAMTPGSEVGQ